MEGLRWLSDSCLPPVGNRASIRRVPHSRRRRGCATVAQAMRNKLQRRHGHRHLHLVARGCYWQPLLGTARKRDACVTLRLNPHPRLRRECGTRKFNGLRLGGVEGRATRLPQCTASSMSRIRRLPRSNSAAGLQQWPRRQRARFAPSKTKAGYAPLTILVPRRDNFPRSPRQTCIRTRP